MLNLAFYEKVQLQAENENIRVILQFEELLRAASLHRKQRIKERITFQHHLGNIIQPSQPYDTLHSHWLGEENLFLSP